MAFVATSVAIGGSALLGAGASIYAGQQQASAARDASGALVDASNSAGRTSVAAGRDALAYLDPYRQYGLNAGVSLQDALYSPQQQQQQAGQQRIALQGEVDRLKAAVPQWVPHDKNDYKHRYPAFEQEYALASSKLQDAQSKLQTFEKQAAAAPQGGQGAQIQESPWYKFQADLLARTQDRAFAARGLTGSGFEAEERRKGLLQLGAQETENQFSRLKGLYDVGAQTAQVGANVITGTANNVASSQLAAGQARAQGIEGVAGANANMVNGIANSVNSNLGLALQQNQWNTFQANLNARNRGYDPVMGTGYRPTPTNPSSYDYLKPVS